MTVLAGLRFVFEPEDGLTPRERAALLGLRPNSLAVTGQPILRVALESRTRTTAAAGAPVEPARVAWNGERLLLEHAAFEAVIDATASVARVRREGDAAAGLVTTLRTALSARLPLEGGVLVHAAALERRGKCFLFFGPSGIGKSTLARRSPWRVIADELAAVLPCRGGGPPRVSSAEFLGAKPPGGAPLEEPQLACLIELAQGPHFRLEPLERDKALRRLLGSLVVPPGPPLWSAALKVASDLVRETPCYRMEWSLGASPFEPLEAALEEGTRRLCDNNRASKASPEVLDPTGTTPRAGARGPRTPWSECSTDQEDPSDANPTDSSADGKLSEEQETLGERQSD
jgi:hypothetical protein